MKIKKAIFFGLLTISLLQTSAQVKHLLPGSHKTGFLSISRYDISRPAVKDQVEQKKGRFLQINIWFPISGTVKNPMTFVDYVTLIGKELDENPKNPHWREKAVDTYFAWPASTGADKKKFTEFLAKKQAMYASNAIPSIKKNYPLVLLVHGFAADYAYLAEYLASYGYIVMHIPVKGTTSAELDYETKGLETQVLDYEYGLKILEKEYLIKVNKAGAVGFSFGGQSVLGLAIRNQQIGAIVSLDGGVGSAFGADLLQSQPFFDSKKIRTPILHLYNPRDQYTDLTWLKSLQDIPRYFAAMKNVEHGHFTSFGLLNNIIPGIMGKSAPNPGDAYETLMLLTKNFLDKELKNVNQKPGDFFENNFMGFPWAGNCIAQAEIFKTTPS